MREVGKVRVNGKNVKSLSFTLLREALESKTKRQTIRMLFIPGFIEEEEVAIAFKTDKVKEFLYMSRITEVFPVKLRDITLDIAQRDGFSTIEACQQALMELNNRTLDHWAFVIRWDPEDD